MTTLEGAGAPSQPALLYLGPKKPPFATSRNRLDGCRPKRHTDLRRALSPRKRAASYALGGTEDSLQRPRIRGLAGGDPDLELQRAPTTFGLSERRAWCGVTPTSQRARHTSQLPDPSARNAPSQPPSHPFLAKPPRSAYIFFGFIFHADSLFVACVQFWCIRRRLRRRWRSRSRRT